jgi:MerR family transcriptional regulator, thiopeptide resistance regulator
LQPSLRSGGNYRLYSEADADRLGRICFYRKMGIPVAQVSDLMARTHGATQEILQRRLETLAAEMADRREQEQQILRLLSQFPKDKKSSRRADTRVSGGKEVSCKESLVVTKDRWVEILSAAGFSDADMMTWHKTFERMEPQAHQEFLESLKIGKEEIARIRKAAQA